MHFCTSASNCCIVLLVPKSPKWQFGEPMGFDLLFLKRTCWTLNRITESNRFLVRARVCHLSQSVLWRADKIYGSFNSKSLRGSAHTFSRIRAYCGRRNAVPCQLSSAAKAPPQSQQAAADCCWLTVTGLLWLTDRPNYTRNRTAGLQQHAITQLINEKHTNIRGRAHWNSRSVAATLHSHSRGLIH